MIKNLLILLLISNLNGIVFSQGHDHGGGAYVIEATHDQCLSEDQRTKIQKRLKHTSTSLQKQGLIDIDKRAVTKLSNPIRKADHLTYDDCYGISNYFDHNSAVGTTGNNQYGSTNLDYNCDRRTYDTNNGYNHAGVDMFTWPFGWYLYQNDMVEVVAAAPGTIIAKDDGNDDDHCECMGSWNAVYIQHRDGSIAWYGHLKKNKLTSKNIGDRVETGEYLGIVASSGCSTGPHLHLELYDTNGDLIDPYEGPCNSTITETWWSEQEDYRESKINTVLTHSDPPQFGCIDEELPNLSNSFEGGQNLLTAVYLRDQEIGDVFTLRIFRPDGTVYNYYTNSSPNTYNASYWWWRSVLPVDAPCGEWTAEVLYQGSSHVHTFTVGTPPEIVIEAEMEFCEGDSVLIAASGAPLIEWTGPSGELGQGNSFYAFEAGEYTAIGYLDNGCSASSSVLVRTSPSPSIEALDGPREVLSGSAASYTAMPSDDKAIYEWTIVNGTITSPTDGPSIDVLWNAGTTGQVCVTATYDSGCQSGQTCYDVLLNPTSTNDIDQLATTIFPNPFDDHIRVLLDDSDTELISIEWFDINGQKIQMPVRKFDRSYQIETAELPTGIYLINLTSSEGKSCHKVLKQ